MINIALNGFGRIGKNFLRIWLQHPTASKKINLSVINVGPADPQTIAYMTLYDTIMGTYKGSAVYENSQLILDNTHTIAVLAQKDATQLNWKSFDIDWVVDVSGHFTARNKALQHIQAGAKKVLMSAPMIDEDISIIPGLNDQHYDSKNHHIVSLGSCTTNALMTTLKVLHSHCGIIKASVSTTHAYTNTQALLDVNAEHKDPRKSRAAALNIIPTSTGASTMLAKIMPELNNNVIFSSLRVPIDVVSLLDITLLSKNKTTTKALNQAFEHASTHDLKNILSITNQPLVSSDFKGNPHSVIIDTLLTDSQDTFSKVFGWYDNEWGYTNRLIDFLLYHA